MPKKKIDQQNQETDENLLKQLKDLWIKINSIAAFAEAKNNNKLLEKTQEIINRAKMEEDRNKLWIDLKTFIKKHSIASNEIVKEQINYLNAYLTEKRTTHLQRKPTKKGIEYSNDKNNRSNNEPKKTLDELSPIQPSNTNNAEKKSESLDVGLLAEKTTTSIRLGNEVQYTLNLIDLNKGKLLKDETNVRIKLNENSVEKTASQWIELLKNAYNTTEPKHGAASFSLLSFFGVKKAGFGVRAYEHFFGKSINSSENNDKNYKSKFDNLSDIEKLVILYNYINDPKNKEKHTTMCFNQVAVENKAKSKEENNKAPYLGQG